MTDAPKRDDEDAWIEKVVNAAGALGFNKMRVRWKLIRWQNARTKAANLRGQQQLHVGYAHKLCRECGAVQDKDEAVCTACGAKLGHRSFHVLRRLGIVAPVAISISTLLAVGILLAYARVWIAGGGGFAAPSGQLLVDFGGRWPPAMADEPWRLVTAVFLHAGLMHLLFNLLAIASIGPRIEELYGRATTLGLFVVTGVLANLGALQVGPMAVGIGASGGLMGLIGVAVGYGQRAGRGRGHGLRDDMLKWSAYTILFGFAVGADNWAHLFGLLAGAAFGLTVRPATWRRRALMPARLLVGLAGAIGTIGAIAIILTRTASPPEVFDQDEGEDVAAASDQAMDRVVSVCVAYYAGDLPGARAGMQAMMGNDVDRQDLDATGIDGMCNSIQEIRERCAHPSSDQAREQMTSLCAMNAPVFAAVPARTPRSKLAPRPEAPLDAAAPPPAD